MATPNKRTDIITIKDYDEIICPAIDLQWCVWVLISMTTPAFCAGSIELLAGELPATLSRHSVFTVHGGTAVFKVLPAVFPRFVQPIFRKRGERATLFIDTLPRAQIPAHADYNMSKLSGVIQ